MPKKYNLLNQRFGRLIVVGDAPVAREPSGATSTRWWCKCDCGREAIIRTKGLLSGGTISCGCYRSEYVAKKNHKHGGAQRTNTEREYKIWCGIIKRCTNPRSQAFRLYGGRGIKMCKRWRDSYEAFRQDMGPCPSYRHSVERLDVNGDYAPNNCVWATPEIQGNNKRTNRMVTLGEETDTATRMWERHGAPNVSFTGFMSRLYRGWSDEEALLTTVDNLRNKL